MEKQITDSQIEQHAKGHDGPGQGKPETQYGTGQDRARATETIKKRKTRQANESTEQHKTEHDRTR